MTTMLFDRDFRMRGGPTPNGKISFTTQQASEALTRVGAEWAADAAGVTTVSYAFRASGIPGDRDTSGFSTFNAQQIQSAELALRAWSDVANIRFARVGSGTDGAAHADNATMLFGNYNAGSDSAAGYASYPGGTGPSSPSGDVWINARLSYNVAPTVGNYGGYVLIHEIGHAIGIAHPGNYNAGEGVSNTYAQNAAYYEDSRQYSVMSYFSEAETGARVSAHAASPLLDDITAVQSLYGRNLAAFTGDTVYGFNSNSNRPWFTAADADADLAFAAWDAGGNDTFDFSGYAQAQRIDLREGRFSDVGGDRGNVAIAYGTTIENAIGGAGGDVLIGNAAGNLLTGNAGDDSFFGGGGRNIINGGDGNDTLFLNGLREDFVSLAGNDGRWTVFDTTGSQDLVSSIESVSGRNGTLAFGSFAATSSGALRYIASNPDLIRAFGADAAAGAQHYSSNGRAEGRSISFDPLRYAASNADLLQVFGTNTEALALHYVANGFQEGRSTTQFNALLYGASSADLARVFGDDVAGLTRHYVSNGFAEGRATASFNPYQYAIANPAVRMQIGIDPSALTLSYLNTGVTQALATTSDFSALRYAASNPDLARAYGTDITGLEIHYLRHGIAENRATATFDATGYALNNPDLISAFGFDTDLLQRHYIQNGLAEGRTSIRFDPLIYAASNPDLARAYGTNAAALTGHYVTFGRAEGRTTDRFDPIVYAASNPDLARAFGTNLADATRHYIDHGMREMRPTTGFDSVAYLLSYGDAQGTDARGAALHYLRGGVNTHPDADGRFGLEQSRHTLDRTSGGLSTPGLFETIGDRDWFSLTLTSQQTVTIRLAGQANVNLDTFLSLHAATGALITSNDDYSGLSSQISMSLAAGTYYLVAATFQDRGQGNYQLTVATASGTAAASPAEQADPFLAAAQWNDGKSLDDLVRDETSDGMRLDDAGQAPADHPYADPASWMRWTVMADGVIL